VCREEVFQKIYRLLQGSGSKQRESVPKYFCVLIGSQVGRDAN
jgi:hypothetical protein